MYSWSWWSIDEEGCASNDGWRLRNTYIDSGIGHRKETYLEMSVKVKGFAEPEVNSGLKQGEYGEVSFVFETKCTGSCKLNLRYVSNNRKARISLDCTFINVFWWVWFYRLAIIILTEIFLAGKELKVNKLTGIVLVVSLLYNTAKNVCIPYYKYIKIYIIINHIYCHSNYHWVRLNHFRSFKITNILTDVLHI